jgi:plasmid stability protein
MQEVLMPALQVRELPEDVYARLRAKAAAEHRSIAQETVVLLRRALRVPESRKDERNALLERIRERVLPQIAEMPPSEVLVREDRDR